MLSLFLHNLLRLLYKLQMIKVSCSHDYYFLNVYIITSCVIYYVIIIRFLAFIIIFNDFCFEIEISLLSMKRLSLESILGV